MKNRVFCLAGFPLLFVGILEARFDFSSLNQAFDQLFEQVNRAVDAEFFSYKFSSAGSGSEISFNTDIAISEDAEFVRLEVALGTTFEADNVTAEQRGGTIIVTLQEDDLMGRLEIDEWSASFGISEYKKKKTTRDEEGQICQTTAFRSSHMVSLPARINLAGDPIVEIKSNKTLIVQLPKYMQKVIEVKKSNGNTKNVINKRNQSTVKKEKDRDAGLEEALRAK